MNAAAGSRPAQPAAAAGSAADRGRQRHAVQPLPRHRRRPRRRGIPAGQDRIVDRNQFVGGHRHRRERAGADVRVHLQQRRADRPHRDRRAGRRPAVVRVQHMSPSTKSRLTVGRAVDWQFAATVGAKLARPGPAATDYTRSQVIDQLAEASRNAELPVREVTGLNEGGEIPEARIVDRVEWIRAATQSMRVMTGGSERKDGASRASSPAASRARRPAPCWRSCRRASSASTTRSGRTAASCCWCTRT